MGADRVGWCRPVHRSLRTGDPHGAGLDEAGGEGGACAGSSWRWPAARSARRTQRSPSCSSDGWPICRTSAGLRPRSTATGGTSTGSWFPTIGGVRLSKLTAGHLDGVYSSLRAAGTGPGDHPADACHRPGGVASGACGGAWCRAMLRRWRRHPRNRSENSYRRPSMRYWRSSTRLRRRSPMFGLYVRLVAATGMRRSEACGLRWSDIDLETGRLVVQRSHLSCPARWATGRPRPAPSGRSRSTPTRFGRLRSAWRAARQLARFAGVDDDRRRAGYVFSYDADGARAWRGDTVTARWSRTRRAAGVQGVRLHDLRHWQATQLLDAGVPVPTVAARLGPRRRHDDDEDLRPPHRPGRRTGGGRGRRRPCPSVELTGPATAGRGGAPEPASSAPPRGGDLR